MGRNHYWSVVLGTRLQCSAFSSSWCDGASLTVEYYHDSENWTGEDFAGYQDYLEGAQASPAAHAAALPYSESFHNSPHYFYAGAALQSLLLTDLQPSLGVVINLSDGSLILNPDISYSLKNNNLLVGLRAFIYLGGSRSEFGSNVARQQLMVHSQFSF